MLPKIPYLPSDILIKKEQQNSTQHLQLQGEEMNHPTNPADLHLEGVAGVMEPDAPKHKRKSPKRKKKFGKYVRGGAPKDSFCCCLNCCCQPRWKPSSCYHLSAHQQEEGHQGRACEGCCLCREGVWEEEAEVYGPHQVHGNSTRQTVR